MIDDEAALLADIRFALRGLDPWPPKCAAKPSEDTPAKSWHISSSAAGTSIDRCRRQSTGHGRVGGERGIRPSAPWVLGVSRLLISLRRQVQLCRRYGYRSVYRIDGGPDEVRAGNRMNPPPAICRAQGVRPSCPNAFPRRRRCSPKQALAARPTA
jgi:hypothetical protein